MIDSSFWKNKRVFLTGHTGFKGSWLSLWLSSMDAELTGYALTPPTNPSLFEICKLNECMNSITGDIRDYETLRSAIQKAKPEIVIHMAAQPLVRASYKIPVETYATNVMGTVHLLEAIRSTEGVKAVVNVTTDKCYENKEWLWGYRENEPMGGYDPYSNSKGCSELVTASYRNSFFHEKDYANHGVALASARAGNVIGGGDWAEDRLIPDAIKALTEKQTIVIRSPKAIRPWQHVLEPLSGYLTLAQNLYEQGPAYAEGWNFGPNETDAKPVEWIIKELCELWGTEATYKIEQNPNQPHEANYLKLDCAKARTKLHWQPQWELGQALQQIVEWVKAYQNNENMRDICLEQIKAYQHSK